jgi:hypothetical protein
MAVSSPLADGSLQHARPLFAAIERVIVVVIAIAVPLAIGVLWSRRLIGALSLPLGWPVLIALGIAISATAAAVRLINKDRWQWLPSVIAIAAVLALSLPGSSTLGLAGLWSFLGLEEGWHWRRWFRDKQARQTAIATDRAGIRVDVEPATDDGTDEIPPVDSSVTQQLVRRRDEQGCESIHAWLRVEFPPETRTLNAHVAFCPPLAVLPQCFAEQADGPPARVKISQVLSQGARLEIKLDREFSAPQSVLVELSACTDEAKLPLGRSAI